MRLKVGNIILTEGTTKNLINQIYNQTGNRIDFDKIQYIIDSFNYVIKKEEVNDNNFGFSVSYILGYINDYNKFVPLYTLLPDEKGVFYETKFDEENKMEKECKTCYHSFKDDTHYPCFECFNYNYWESNTKDKTKRNLEKENNKMNKVKLPKNVAEAIETMRKSEMTNFAIISSMQSKDWVVYNGCKLSEVLGANEVLNKYSFGDNYNNSDKVIEAVVNGYDIEMSPEEKIKQCFDEYVKLYSTNDEHSKTYSMAFNDGVIFTLDELGIKIEGINKLL